MSVLGNVLGESRSGEYRFYRLISIFPFKHFVAELLGGDAVGEEDNSVEVFAAVERAFFFDDDVVESFAGVPGQVQGARGGDVNSFIETFELLQPVTFMDASSSPGSR